MKLLAGACLALAVMGCGRTDNPAVTNGLPSGNGGAFVTGDVMSGNSEAVMSNLHSTGQQSASLGQGEDVGNGPVPTRGR